MPGIAIIGASDRGIPWSEWLVMSLEQYGYADPIWLVNPNRTELIGRPCHPSLDALPEVPDVGVIVVGAERAVGALEDLATRGCRRVILISNGFGEQHTAEGRAREERLREICRAHDVQLVGPNCVGFASFHERLCAISQPVPPGIEAGPVSIVSQSGGLTGAAMGAVAAERLGMDQCYSIGNGAVFGLPQAVAHLVARESTRVVCCVVEAIGDRDALEAAARAARERGVLLAFLLLGKSQAGRRVAQSHTGAVVGEERMLASWLRELGVVLADSPEELGRIARLQLTLGGAEGRRGMIATVSGGGAGHTADLASRHGVRLAALSAESTERLRGLLPDGAFVGNPLDVQTGDGTAVYSTLAGDPGVDYLIEPWVLPWPDGTPTYRWQQAALERIVGIGREHGIPVIVGSLFQQPLSAWAEELGRRPGVSVTPDLDLTLAALGKLSPASEAPPTAERDETPGPPAAAIVAEARAREILAAAGLPVVAGHEAAGADEVVALAGALRAPFALKVSLPDVGHKERIGGVKLGLSNEQELRAACSAIAASAVAAGAAASEAEVGFLLTEMRFGAEVLVGALRDPVAGPTLTVGVGGWGAEAGALFGTVVLPKDAAALAELAARWRLPHLLGERRTRALVGVLEQVAAAFAGGELEGYQAVELNPVILDGEGAVVVDALLVEA